MSLEITPLDLPGCLRLQGSAPRDDRGMFHKAFQRSAFAERGLPVDFSEQFFSRSWRGVVRGLHLQLPPSEQWKLVTCLLGRVHDVLLDVRTGSPTYGRAVGVDLDADSGVSLLMPPGIAHGFLSLADDTVMGYWVTSEHDPATDTGVRWDSAGIAWPHDGEPVVSARDRALPPLAEFVSPIVFAPGRGTP